MHDPIGIPHELRPRSALERSLDQAARGLAVAGGLVFIGLIAMSLVSIVGRKLNLLVVTGDIEMMQAGTAIAVACFLPYCTLLGEHLKVEFFTENSRPIVRNVLDLIGDALIAAVFVVLTWRTALQVIDMTDSGEVTPLLSIPMWKLVAGVLPGLVFTAVGAIARAGFAASALLAPAVKEPAVKEKELRA